jgi:hypothetical protein
MHRATRGKGARARERQKQERSGERGGVGGLEFVESTGEKSAIADEISHPEKNPLTYQKPTNTFVV